MPKQIIGSLLDAKVTNPLDHMSVAFQAHGQCSNRTELCRTGKYRHTVHPHVSSHRILTVSEDDCIVSGCELTLEVSHSD